MSFYIFIKYKFFSLFYQTKIKWLKNLMEKMMSQIVRNFREMPLLDKIASCIAGKTPWFSLDKFKIGCQYIEYEVKSAIGSSSRYIIYYHLVIEAPDKQKYEYFIDNINEVVEKIEKIVVMI